MLGNISISISLCFSPEYLVRGYLSKQIFDDNWSQSPSNLNFLDIFYISKVFLRTLIKI